MQLLPRWGDESHAALVAARILRMRFWYDFVLI